MSDIHVKQIDYHRNGVSGEPFHVVHFDTEQDGAMMAVVFEPDDREQFHNPRVAVFQESQLPDTEFGRNSWRGDTYSSALYDAIIAYDAGLMEGIENG